MAEPVKARSALLRRRRRRRQLVAERQPPRCRRCRRPLSDAASRARRLGPHCLRLLRRRRHRTGGFPAVRAYRRRAQIPGQTEIDISERTRP